MKQKPKKSSDTPEISKEQFLSILTKAAQPIKPKQFSPKKS